MQLKKHLSFTSLRKFFSKTLLEIKENRQTSKIEHSLHDSVMAGYACMFLQCSSLLEYQRRLEKYTNKNNLKTQFNVHTTPSDTVIRSVIDSVSSQIFAKVFKEYLSRLQRGKHLIKYEFLPGLYLLPIDGTQYFSSKEISCEHCLTQTNKGGSVTYSHKVVQAAIVHPDLKQVLPMMPEEIKNSDGGDKQDCEINAAKRLMPAIKQLHPRLHFIRTGDSLYAKQPFIEATLEQGDSFFFAVKPTDHKKMYDFINNNELNKTKEVDAKGRTFVYEWINNVPLNGNDNTTFVNYFRCRLVTPQGNEPNKVTYIGSWITNLPINNENIALYVRGSRCRWRVENECFNTLKNNGYELTHNYGHGKNNLCFNFYVLTLLAFFSHQILELTDLIYQKTRKSLVTLRSFWQEIRVMFNRFLFESWEYMLDFILDSEKYLGKDCTPRAPPFSPPSSII